MKNLIMVTLFSGVFCFAQEKTAQKQMTPEQRTEMRLEYLKKDLALNSQQEKQVKQALMDQETRIKTLKANKKERKPNEKLTMQEKLALNSQIKKEQETMAQKMKSILTPEQFKKWEAEKDARIEKLKKELK